MSTSKGSNKNKRIVVEERNQPLSTFNNLNVPFSSFPFLIPSIAPNNLLQSIDTQNKNFTRYPQPLPHPSTDANVYHSNQKICSFCKKEPTFSCYRCEAYYCSQECQKNDWQNHRHTCFSMPPLVPIKGTTRTAPPISPLPKNGSHVRLTGFRRSNLCYVRSLEPKNDEQFRKGCNIINKYGATAQLLTELPSSNTFAIALYEGNYHRIQVLSASNSDSIRVLFVDVGIVKTIKLSELRKITENIIKILQQTVAIKLKGVKNYIINTEIEHFLKGFYETDFIVECKEDEENKEFVLHQLDSFHNLNELIATFANKQTNLGIYEDFNIHKTNYDNERKNESERKNEKKEKLSKVKPDKNPILSPPFEFNQFDENDLDFVIVVLNNTDIIDGLFGCIARNNKKFLDMIESYFKIYVDTRIPYEPELYEYCLAKTDGKWRRVQILSIYKNIYTTIDVDTTFENKVTKEKIRRYPDNLKIPCSTVTCKIYGIRPTSSSKLVENFIKRRFIINSQHRINKVLKIENGIRQVQMDDLIDELILDFQIEIK